MPNSDVDPTTLTEQQIRDAVIYHCQKMGSYNYYIQDEFDWIRRDPGGLRVWREESTGRLRAYHTRERRS